MKHDWTSESSMTSTSVLKTVFIQSVIHQTTTYRRGLDWKLIMQLFIAWQSSPTSIWFSAMWIWLFFSHDSMEWITIALCDSLLKWCIYGNVTTFEKNEIEIQEMCNNNLTFKKETRRPAALIKRNFVIHHGSKEKKSQSKLLSVKESWKM